MGAAVSAWRGRWAALAVAALVTLLALGLAPRFFQSVDERATDAIWRLFPQPEEERRLIIVDIDEASLARHGPWPWPRDQLAQLVERLREAGAGMLLFDIVFPEARLGDDRLRASMASIPSVLAQVFDLSGHAHTSLTAGELYGALDGPRCTAPLPVAKGYIGNTPTLAGARAGHITPFIAEDGVVRRLPALVCHGGKAYPALGLAALLAASHAPPELTVVAGKGWWEPPYWLGSPAWGGRVPLDAEGGVRLSYQKPRTAFISIPAADILEGHAPIPLLHGAWVLIGATAFGIGDVVPTPQGGAVGGVEVHAHFISNLLDGTLPYTPLGRPWIQTGLALAGGLGLLLLMRMGRRQVVFLVPLAAMVLSLGLIALHGWVLLSHNLWLGWSGPASFLLLAGIALSVQEHARTRSERERLFANLSSYLPATVAKELALRAPSGVIEARRQEVTVLVADIRNYSAYCEGRSPEEAAALLHAYFTLAVEIIERHGGVVENFIGDAVLAVWDASDEQGRHPRHALAAARRLLQESAALFPSKAPPGLEPLALGIGIETGQALIGSFGPADRRVHTALGETVTVAIRLQAMTADLAHPILIGPDAAKRLGEAAVRPLGEFLLEGLRQPRALYGI